MTAKTFHKKHRVKGAPQTRRRRLKGGNPHTPVTPGRREKAVEKQVKNETILPHKMFGENNYTQHYLGIATHNAMLNNPTINNQPDASPIHLINHGINVNTTTPNRKRKEQSNSSSPAGKKKKLGLPKDTKWKNVDSNQLVGDIDWE